MIHVSVTAEDIAEGVAGDCHSCPVARALIRATKDTEPMVYEHDWSLYLKVWSRSIQAPQKVRDFVNAFDGQPRTIDGLIDTDDPDYTPMEPFGFTLPDQDDPEWQESCCNCGDLFDASELDDEGYCEDCLAKP